MPLYLFRWQFTAASAKNFIADPQDRTDAAHKLISDFGGKMLSYYFAQGEYDGYGVFELADAATATAVSMAAAATGGYSRMESSQVFTGKEAKAIMKKAKTVATAYRAPNQ